MTAPDPATAHSDDAIAYLALADNPHPDDTDVHRAHLARAQVAATLALVEEQRTANLLTAMREAREMGQGDYQMALGDQVAARLGLNR